MVTWRKIEKTETAWVPVSLAAEMLKVSRQRVHQLITAGAIVAQFTGKLWLVSVRSIEARVALLEAEGKGDFGRW